MNKDIKKTVYKILDKDNLAREDTMHLIQETLVEMLPCKRETNFEKVIQEMKLKGISFEAITRAKRKFLEEHPELISKTEEKIRNMEEECYIEEYSNHIPRID